MALGTAQMYKKGMIPALKLLQLLQLLIIINYNY